ncbi:unnamed protein product [Orchesella dallaii]|uniref:G protein-coupled receptor n=1 Tax=Orchesella dallaii TaxID=48710 RepID=A0ABP1RFM8_9HEXA
MSASVQGLGLLSTLQTVVIALFSVISGGSAVAGMVYGEKTAEFFNRLLSLEKYMANEFKDCPFEQKRKSSLNFLHDERFLNYFTKMLIFIAATFTLPIATLAIIENIEPFGNVLECFILPSAYHRTMPTILAVFLLRLIMAWIATIETARSSTFLLLVFHAVTQIYLKLLQQLKRHSIQKRRRILKCYVILQTIHIDAEPCGNVLIALVMCCGIGLYTISVWMTINCWERVPIFVYVFAFSFSLVIPFLIMALMPFAVRIHENSTAIIKSWKTESAAKWYSNSYDRRWVGMRIKAARRITFSCGIHFHLKHSTKITYLQATIDQAIDALIAIPAPTGKSLEWFDFFQ